MRLYAQNNLTFYHHTPMKKHKTNEQIEKFRNKLLELSGVLDNEPFEINIGVTRKGFEIGELVLNDKNERRKRKKN